MHNAFGGAFEVGRQYGVWNLQPQTSEVERGYFGHDAGTVYARPFSSFHYSRKLQGDLDFRKSRMQYSICEYSPLVSVAVYCR